MTGAAPARVVEAPVARRTDESRLAERIEAHERALDAGEAEEMRLKARLDVLMRENERHRDALARLRGTPTLNVAEALRVFLEEHGPATAREAERWLRRRGFTTTAESFYHSVYATLRAMPEVAGLVKQGEITKFVLKEGLRVPAGWHKVEFPRRNSAASRKTQ